jgi:hypothetical protein
MSDLGGLAAAAMAAGAEELADRLRALGFEVEVEGSRVLARGRGLRAREFGSAGREPRPVVGPVVEAFGPRLVRMVAAAMEEGRHG